MRSINKNALSIFIIGLLNLGFGLLVSKLISVHYGSNFLTVFLESKRYAGLLVPVAYFGTHVTIVRMGLGRIKFSLAASVLIGVFLVPIILFILPNFIARLLFLVAYLCGILGTIYRVKEFYLFSALAGLIFIQIIPAIAVSLLKDIFVIKYSIPVLLVILIYSLSKMGTINLQELKIGYLVLFYKESAGRLLADIFYYSLPIIPLVFVDFTAGDNRRLSINIVLALSGLVRLISKPISSIALVEFSKHQGYLNKTFLRFTLFLLLGMVLTAGVFMYFDLITSIVKLIYDYSGFSVSDQWRLVVLALLTFILNVLRPALDAFSERPLFALLLGSAVIMSVVVGWLLNMKGATYWLIVPAFIGSLFCIVYVVQRKRRFI